jgi:hypothetical protein
MVSILDEAAVPSAPSSPKPLPLLISGVVLGLIAAVLAALVTRSLVRRRRLADRIAAKVGAPLLGSVPKPGARDDGRGPDPVVAYQDLRTNLDVAMRPRPGWSLSVSAVGDPAAATEVSAALGLGLATVGRDVVLIDGDVRDGTLQQLIEDMALVPVDPGVPEDLVLELESPAGVRLRFVPAGSLRQLARAAAPGAGPRRGKAVHPADALAVGLPRLIDVAHDERITVIGAPSVPAVAEDSAEARIAGAAAGLVLLVADARQRRLVPTLERAAAQLTAAGAEVAGVVLSGARRGLRRRRAVSGTTLPAVISLADPGPASPVEPVPEPEPVAAVKDGPEPAAAPLAVSGRSARSA